LDRQYFFIGVGLEVFVVSEDAIYMHSSVKGGRKGVTSHITSGEIKPNMFFQMKRKSNVHSP